MKLKSVAVSMAVICLPWIAQARLAGFSTKNAIEKELDGFQVSSLKLKVNNSYVLGSDFTATLEKDNGNFKLLLHGNAAFPTDFDGNIGESVNLELAPHGIELNPSISSEIYDQLAIDYTPKKMQEGIEIGSSLFKCFSPLKCNIERLHQSLWMFEGLIAKHSGRRLPSTLSHVHNLSFKFKGKVLNADGTHSIEFINAVKNSILEIAPDTIKYLEVRNSSPSHTLSREEQMQQAEQNVEISFGKTELERKVLKSLLSNLEVSYRNLVKKSSGSSGCTYFCSPTGEFVRGTVKADANF